MFLYLNIAYFKMFFKRWLAFSLRFGYDRYNHIQAVNAMNESNLTILYEDDALLVCVKPRGILSAKDASGKCSAAELLLPRTVYPVHRLDRETCGLLVFAKTQSCAAFLSAAIVNGSFFKEYLAVCEGCPPKEGELTDLLFYDRSANKAYVVRRKRNGVKQARLTYRVLRSGEHSLLQIRLFTGRTHQIRVQFASRGYPLLGDRKYGAESAGALQLYAWRLHFPHPDGRTLCFTLPDSFLPAAYTKEA